MQRAKGEPTPAKKDTERSLGPEGAARGEKAVAHRMPSQRQDKKLKSENRATKKQESSGLQMAAFLFYLRSNFLRESKIFCSASQCILV